MLYATIGTAMTTFQKGDTFNLTWHVASPHPVSITHTNTYLICTLFSK